MPDLAQARQRYWQVRADLDRVGRLLSPRRHPFAAEVIRTHWSRLTGRRSGRSVDARRALEAAIAWLLRAQAATPDAGVSLGYFPCDFEEGWRASYPETTGYIIQTLLDYAVLHDSEQARRCALQAADWETGIQMPSGGVQGGPVCAPDQQREAVFNTGMVLQGYTAAYRESGERRYLEAGRRAADFLVGDMDAEGHFRTHGGFVASARIKTYNVLCAWAMIRFSEDSGESAYARAAVRNAEAALGRQRANGWFDDNDLDLPDHPLTHTIGYTLQGLLEVGVCSGRDDFVAAVRRGVDPILERIGPDGYLAGRFDADWRPAVSSVCLTGSAQIAIVLYRLHELSASARYRDAADRLVAFLVDKQRLDSPDEGINGAIAGSFPLFGEYMKAGYPNWATKYFADALMLHLRLGRPVDGTRNG